MESGQYEQATGKLPDWWDKCPPHVRGDDFYIEAFWELSSCRDFGMGIGPIPWHRIVQYGEWKKLDDGMMRLFIRIIRELDDAYVKDLNEDRRHETEQQRRQAKQKLR